MVVVSFDYSEFKKLLDIPKEKVIGGLTEIGAPAEVEPETGKIFVELTPNRPDWYSLEGLARALRSYYKKENRGYTAKESDYKVIVDEGVSEIRPYTACAVIKNLKFDDQKIRDVVLLQEKLLATLGRHVKRFGIGVYPLKEIEFPVRYTAMKPEKIIYKPLNYPSEANAWEILKEHPKGQEYGYIIEKFDKFPVFVDNKDRIMALIPIVNSAETGKVDMDTREVFVEVSGNDTVGIKQALNIIVCSFADMGGEVYTVEIAYPEKSEKTPDLDYVRMKIDVKKTERVLGVELGVDKIKEMLLKMGYGMEGKDALVPPYRADVLDEIDIVEDIAIVYGYNNFEPTTPDFFTPGKLSRDKKGISSIMEGMGFVEVVTFILTNKDKLVGVGHGGKLKEIINPATEEFTTLRPTLVADMVDIFITNKMSGLPQKFYEIGTVYEGGKTKKKLCFGIADTSLEFSDARGYLQTLMKEIGVEYGLEEREYRYLEPPFSTAITTKKGEIGVLGKLSRKICEENNVGFDVYVCEISLW
jgi:phenylalanyl-tRNA synthetase beta chain